MAKLLAAVGTGGVNAHVDVTAVQNLINQSIRTITPLAPLRVTGLCDGLTIEAITQFQRRVVRLPAADGRVDPGGRTFQALVVTASGGVYQAGQFPFAAGISAPAAPATPVPSHNGRYTDNPNEVVTKTTVPAPKEVIAMLRSGWTELSEQGARTLTAQFLFETGGGKNCFNWNLGNVKAVTNTVPHMYLRNTTEGFPAGAAEFEVNHGGGLARIATAEEVKAKGWAIAGRAVVVFQPPHPTSRFLAYPSLTIGATGWMNHHKRLALKFATYLASANAGDCIEVAHLLKMAHYYTGNEGTYARQMTNKKAELDRSLGAAT